MLHIITTHDGLADFMERSVESHVVPKDSTRVVSKPLIPYINGICHGRMLLDVLFSPMKLILIIWFNFKPSMD